MSETGKHSFHAALRRIAATGIALAAVTGAGSLAAPAADAAPGGPPVPAPAGPGTDSILGLVSQYQTPVHPEAVTHPGDDFMGSTIAAHLARNPPSAQAAQAAPAAGAPPAAAAAPTTTSAAAPATPSATAAAPAPAPAPAPAVQPRSATPPVNRLPGIDVSSYQGTINWATASKTIDFAYAKATEGTYYTNPDFPAQYNGAYTNGVIRGAYHFAIPSNSTGAAQADYFIAHGGGWTPDGKTLPGVLDIEYNPYGAECYGLTKTQMTMWVYSFVVDYLVKEHTYPLVYSTTDWWTTCTGNTYAGFGPYVPLWVADYGSNAGTLPLGWNTYTFWQFADSGPEPGDQDYFNGTLAQLQALTLAD
ncbi:MAG TPA: lysozyme [Actinocrinis sp.]|nr:lysozyme [Actinocrinis sp.]